MYKIDNNSMCVIHIIMRVYILVCILSDSIVCIVCVQI